MSALKDRLHFLTKMISILGANEPEMFMFLSTVCGPIYSFLKVAENADRVDVE